MSKKSKKGLNDSPQRWKAIYKKYGITREDYFRILDEQGGVCFICLRDPLKIRPKRNLAVDHSHSTGEIRGLLCYSCNHRLMGYMVKEDVDKVRRLLEYLTRKVSYGKVPETVCSV